MSEEELKEYKLLKNEFNTLFDENIKLIYENKKLNFIIKTFEGYLDNVLYTYRKDDLNEACVQLKLAKDKLKRLKED